MVADGARSIAVKGFKSPFWRVEFAATSRGVRAGWQAPRASALPARPMHIPAAGIRIQREFAIPGITCNSGSGLIEISPMKGRSYASIGKIDAATPVAKTPIVIIEASRSLLWTIPIMTRP